MKISQDLTGLAICPKGLVDHMLSLSMRFLLEESMLK